MKRFALPFLLCLLILGGVGVAHGAGTKPTPVVAIAGDDVSGTTGMAAVLEGFDFVGIEQDAEYVELARRRIAHVERHGERWLAAARTAKQQPGIVPPAPDHYDGLPIFAKHDPSPREPGLVA